MDEKADNGEEIEDKIKEATNVTGNSTEPTSTSVIPNITETTKQNILNLWDQAQPSWDAMVKKLVRFSVKKNKNQIQGIKKFMFLIIVLLILICIFCFI